MVDFSSLLDREKLEYILAPKETGYDVPKTLLYSLILVGLVYGLYGILKRFKVGIDRRLAISVTPYIIFGALIRVLQDSGAIDSYFFMTPGIYFLVAGITLFSLSLSIALEKNMGVDYYKTAFIIGLLTIPIPLTYLSFPNIGAGQIVLAGIIPWLLIFKIPWKTENKIVTLLHIFDSTTTAVAMSFFGYYEQHVLPTAFINTFNPFAFIVLKAVSITAILLLIDRISEDGDFNNYIKLVIGILGAATGSRDIITLMAGI